jgi:hypothetical protein
MSAGVGVGDGPTTLGAGAGDGPITPITVGAGGGLTTPITVGAGGGPITPIMAGVPASSPTVGERRAIAANSLKPRPRRPGLHA